MSVPTPEENHGLDGSDRTTLGAFVDQESRHETEDGELGDSLEHQMLRIAQEAYSTSNTYVAGSLRSAWNRSYAAFGNRHNDGSKYRSPQYAGRSKLFRPKTRIAIRKKMREAAAAMFSSGDVVSIEPQNEANREQEISAELKQEIMNYRLRNKSFRSGVPWFLTAMGALQDAQIVGICTSKQTWRFVEDDSGEIVEDKPDIQLFPPENVILDPNCDWRNPAQTASYIGLRHLMTVDDAWDLVNDWDRSTGSRVPWYTDLKKSEFRAKARSSAPSDTQGTRTSREGGRDPSGQATKSFGRVQLIEWFIRRGRSSYVFWTLDTDTMLSEPASVREIYPEQRGARPIVIGYGAIEAHKVFPMSPVESWQPLQQEINDTVNLRLDHMKNIISPPSLVRRGRKVDLNAVQARGPNRIILVDNIEEDVKSMPMADTPQGAFVENNYLNADMDDLTGSMNMGTVQTNQALNETVGGMSLIAGDSASMSEFDLHVFVETWVQQTLAQVNRLIEMYEDDATVLAVCGEKAKLFQKYGVNDITDKLLETDTELTIKAGIGASSMPGQRLQKFQMASQIAGQILQPFVEGGLVQPPRPKVKELIDHIFGDAGFKEASTRFFHPIDDDQPPPPPAPPQPSPDAQMKVQADLQKTQMKLQADAMELKVKQDQFAMEMEDNAREREQQAMSDRMRAMTDIGRQIQEQQRDRARAEMDREYQMTDLAVKDRQERTRAQLDTMTTLLKSRIDAAAKVAVAEKTAKLKPKPAPRKA